MMLPAVYLFLFSNIFKLQLLLKLHKYIKNFRLDFLQKKKINPRYAVASLFYIQNDCARRTNIRKENIKLNPKRNEYTFAKKYFALIFIWRVVQKQNPHHI